MRFLECLKLAGKVLHGNSYLWSMMKKSSVSRMQRLMYSQILCYVLERWIRTQHQILFGTDSWGGSKIHYNSELWTQSTENRWNSSGMFSQDPPHRSLSVKSKNSWAKWANPKNSKDKSFSCRCSKRSYGELKTMKRNVLLIPHLCLCSQKIFPAWRWSFLGPGSETKCILLTTKDHKENGTESLNWWWSNSKKADTKFSDPRVHCLEERSKAKEVDNHRHTSVPMGIRLKLFFAQLFISVNQLSIYGAVSDVCEEYGTCQTRTGRPVEAEQSDRLFAPADLLIMTPTPRLKFLHKKIFYRSTKEWVEKLPQPDQLIKICSDAGFLKTVEVGPYFMTKHIDEFLQFAEPVTCSEYTLPRDDKLTDPKGWIQGNTKIGPVLEVTTRYLQGKHWVGIRIESVNKDNSHSWVRISHGLNKLVTDLIDMEYDDDAQALQQRRKYLRLQADPRLKQNQVDLQLLAHLQGLYLFVKEFGLILNQELNSIKHTQWQKE